MTYYNNIINPVTKKIINIKSNEGKYLITNYLKNYLRGGSNLNISLNDCLEYIIDSNRTLVVGAYGHEKHIINNKNISLTLGYPESLDFPKLADKEIFKCWRLNKDYAYTLNLNFNNRDNIVKFKKKILSKLKTVIFDWSTVKFWIPRIISDFLPNNGNLIIPINGINFSPWASFIIKTQIITPEMNKETMKIQKLDQEINTHWINLSEKENNNCDNYKKNCIKLKYKFINHAEELRKTNIFLNHDIMKLNYNSAPVISLNIKKYIDKKYPNNNIELNLTIDLYNGFNKLSKKPGFFRFNYNCIKELIQYWKIYRKDELFTWESIKIYHKYYDNDLLSYVEGNLKGLPFDFSNFFKLDYEQWLYINKKIHSNYNIELKNNNYPLKLQKNVYYYFIFSNKYSINVNKFLINAKLEKFIDLFHSKKIFNIKELLELDENRLKKDFGFKLGNFVKFRIQKSKYYLKSK